MRHIICVACSSNLYPKLKNMTFPVSPIYGYVFSNQLQVCNKQTSSLGWSKFEFRKINFVITIFFLKMPLKSKTLITYWVPLQHRYIFSTKTWWLHNVLTGWVIFMSHVYSRTRITSMLVTSWSDGDRLGSFVTNIHFSIYVGLSNPRNVINIRLRWVKCSGEVTRPHRIQS